MLELDRNKCYIQISVTVLGVPIHTAFAYSKTFPQQTHTLNAGYFIDGGLLCNIKQYTGYKPAITIDNCMLLCKGHMTHY